MGGGGGGGGGGGELLKAQTFLGAMFQELYVSRGGRPVLSVLTTLLVSVDVKQY